MPEDEPERDGKIGRAHGQRREKRSRIGEHKVPERHAQRLGHAVGREDGDLFFDHPLVAQALEAAEAIAEGNLTRPIKVDGSDEAGRPAAAWELPCR